MRNAREEQRATESEGITVLSRSTKYSLVSVLARVSHTADYEHAAIAARHIRGGEDRSLGHDDKSRTRRGRG